MRYSTTTSPRPVFARTFLLPGAGHDMRGATHYLGTRIRGLHYALQCLIDYKGFRMTAQVHEQQRNVTGFSVKPFPSSSCVVVVDFHSQFLLFVSISGCLFSFCLLSSCFVCLFSTLVLSDSILFVCLHSVRFFLCFSFSLFFLLPQLASDRTFFCFITFFFNAIFFRLFFFGL